MKVIIENGRWKEIVTKICNITEISKTPLSPNSDEFLKSNIRLFGQNSRTYKKRSICNCCKRKWKQEKIYLVFTDKGNKIICKNCKNKLEKKGE